MKKTQEDAEDSRKWWILDAEDEVSMKKMGIRKKMGKDRDITLILALKLRYKLKYLWNPQKIES